MKTTTIIKIITVIGAILTGVGEIMQDMVGEKPKRKSCSRKVKILDE